MFTYKLISLHVEACTKGVYGMIIFIKLLVIISIRLQNKISSRRGIILTVRFNRRVVILDRITNTTSFTTSEYGSASIYRLLTGFCHGFDILDFCVVFLYFVPIHFDLIMTGLICGLVVVEWEFLITFSLAPAKKDNKRYKSNDLKKGVKNLRI